MGFPPGELNLGIKNLGPIYLFQFHVWFGVRKFWNIWGLRRPGRVNFLLLQRKETHVEGARPGGGGPRARFPGGGGGGPLAPLCGKGGGPPRGRGCGSICFESSSVF